MNKKEGIFYGWWIVICCFLIMSIIYAPIINLISVYAKPVSTDLGVKMPTYTYYFTIMSLTSLVALPFVGQMMKKFNNKIIIILGILMCGTSFIGFSMANDLKHFYALAVVQGIGFTTACLIPPSLLVTNWFNEKRGLALGLVMSGSGIGGAVLSIFMTQLIVSHSWRTAYMVTGCMILLMIPLVVFVIKLKPSDIGLEPLGQVLVRGEAKGLTQKESMATISFWLLFIAIIVTAIFINGFSMYSIPYLTGLKYTPQNAALILSVSMISLALAKIVIGRTYDRLGITPTIWIVGICTLLALISYKCASIKVFGVAGAMLMGVAGTHMTVTISYLTASFFGDKDFGAKYSVMSIAAGLGATLAPIVSGMIYNNSKNFSTLIYIFMGFAIVAFILYLVSNSLRPKYNTVNIESQKK
ncbi:MFS transporter [uncultured Clostridium sp.]|uniref:MFS transporter n=1 Tax=uncultured Clostridium sp. TaxID=59620 RepID=UPI003217780C